METIPNEILLGILTLVDDPTTCSFACKLWKDLLSGSRRLKGAYCKMLAKNNYTELTKWAVKNGCVMYPVASYYFAKRGNLSMLKWLHSCRIECSLSLEGAVTGNRIEILDWYDEIKYSIPSSALAKLATKADNVIVLDWLYQRCKKPNHSGFSDSMGLTVEAASHGKCRAMTWLVDHGFPIIETYTIAGAAQNGHINVLQWFLNNGYPIQLDVAVAAKAGQLDVVKWLCQRDLVPAQLLCEKAIAGDKVEVVKWLLSNYQDHPFDRFSIRHLARLRGSEEMKKCLIDLGVW